MTGNSEPASRTIAVAGGSLSGLRTVEALRRAGWSERIVVVGAEPHLPYTRPPLSKKFLLGEAHGHDSVALRRKPDDYETHWRTGISVVGANLRQREIHTADGERIGFDGLVAATGVRARRLPFEGGAHRHVVRTLDDAAALSGSLRPGARVIVIGSGFIGCEVAAAATARDCAVEVVSLDAEPMQLPLGARIGAAIRARHENAGVSFHLGRGVVSLESQPEAHTVVLDDGTELRAAVVVEAIGSAPNCEWLDGNGLDLSDGVRCEESLRVFGAPGVVAVGDVARFPNAWSDGVPRRIEHWQIACETAAHAAKTLLSELGADTGSAPFATVPTFWSDQGAVSIRAIGSPALGDSVEILEGDLGGEAAIGYRLGDRLIGVALLGLPRRLGHYLRLVQESGTPEGMLATS